MNNIFKVTEAGWDRAARIVRDLTGADYATAEKALRGSGWVIKKAVARLGRK